MNYSSEFAQTVASIALGTPMGAAHILTQLEVRGIAVPEGVDEDEIDEILRDENLELCWECGWWCEASELCNEDQETVSCLLCGNRFLPE